MKTQLKGSLFILASAVFFGTYGIWSKMMMGIFDDFFQGWTRSLIILLILAPIGILTKSFRKIKKEDFKWHVLYAFPGSLVIPLYYYAFTHLSIGTATLTFYASLTITSYILGFAFFKEKVTLAKIASLILGMGGLYAIYSLSVTVNPTLVIPLFVAILAGVCGGIEVVFTKKLSGRYSPIQLTFFLYAVTLILCLGFYLVIHHGTIVLPPSPIAWIGTIIHAIASTAAFFLVVIGYKNIEPSVGGIVGLMEIVFGIFFGFLFFHEAFTPAVITGGILIIIAAALPNIAELSKSSQ
jgi:drug/metabolite transporter (DMT)-like permease